MSRHVPDHELLCMECMLPCQCALYLREDGHVEPHAHCPGGDDRYMLCDPCEQRWLARHRIMSPADSHPVQWLRACAEGCPYDEIVKHVAPHEGISSKAR